MAMPSLLLQTLTGVRPVLALAVAAAAGGSCNVPDVLAGIEKVWQLWIPDPPEPGQLML